MLSMIFLNLNRNYYEVTPCLSPRFPVVGIVVDNACSSPDTGPASGRNNALVDVLLAESESLRLTPTFVFSMFPPIGIV